MRHPGQRNPRGPAKTKKVFRYVSGPKPSPATDDDWIGLHRIHAALTELDAARANLATAHNNLKHVVACSDKKPSRRQFEKFTMCGGCTANQFADFVEGTFRGTPTRQRKHLRIVSNTGKQCHTREFTSMDDDLPPAA